MKEIDYKLLFLEGLAEPDYSRVEFWAKQQPESGYSKGVFWMKLNEWFNHYNQKIKLDIESQLVQGNNVLDCAYSLLIETNGKLVGHIGKNELTSLGLSLHLLGKKWKLGNDGYNHRERAIAHLIKVECGEAQPMQRKDQKPKQFEKAFDSLNPKTRNRDNPYREPTQKELEKAIQLLEDSPKAQKKAKERLQKLVKAKD